MQFVLGFLSSLAATVLFVAVTTYYRRRLEATGEVAGYWLQLTYEVGDQDRQQPIRSIELLVLRHHKQEITGTMWRLYCKDWAKRWSFVGRHDHGVVSGVYWWDRDPRGGFGSLLMTREQPWLYSGDFFWTVYDHTPDGHVTSTRRGEPMDWIALQACHAVGVRKITDRYLASASTEYLPARCRAVLGCEHAYWRARIKEGLTHAGALLSTQQLGGLMIAQTAQEGLRDLRRSDLIDESE